MTLFQDTPAHFGKLTLNFFPFFFLIKKVSPGSSVLVLLPNFLPNLLKEKLNQNEVQNQGAQPWSLLSRVRSLLQHLPA